MEQELIRSIWNDLLYVYVYSTFAFFNGVNFILKNKKFLTN